MTIDIKSYFFFRRQEQEIIDCNADAIALFNLRMLKIGLIVCLVIFLSTGIFLCFHKIYRAIPYFVFCTGLFIFYGITHRVRAHKQILILFYVVYEFFILFSIYTMTMQQEVLSVVGVCLLSVLPSEILDRSYRVEIYAFVNTLAMCVGAWFLKSSSSVAAMDTFHFLGAFLIGYSVGMHTRYSSFHRLELQRRADDQRFYDFLTGLANRRKLFLDLHSQPPLSVMMIDIDYFKQYNDTFGHQEGDEVLKKVAHVLREESFRSGVVFYRYGGEEFIGIDYRGTGNMLAFCNAVKDGVEALGISFPKSPFGKVTVSVGFADHCVSAHEDSAEFVRMADTALYAAKHKGRNRVQRYAETDFHQDIPEIEQLVEA